LTTDTCTIQAANIQCGKTAIPQRAAHKISVLKRFLYFCISGVSEPGKPKAVDAGAARIGDAALGRRF